MKSSLVRGWLAVLVVALGAYAAYSGWRIYQKSAANEPEQQSQMVLDNSPRPMPELEQYGLVDRSGANLRSRDLAGHVWVGNIFFATCNGECLKLTHVMRELQNAHPELRLLSVTCDPDNDTPTSLKAYADANRADPNRWLFVTGKLPQLQHITRDLWGVPLQRVGHSPRVVLFDRAGTFRGSYNVMIPAEEQRLAEWIEKLLSEETGKSG